MDATAVSLLDDYLTRLPEVPLLAVGDYGTGRGYSVEKAIREHGFEPLWLYESVEAPTDDLSGKALFPVYDLRKPERPPSVPSIVLVPRDSERPDELKDAEEIAFAPPGEWEIEELFEARGIPKSLAKGNPTYSSALQAALAYEVSGVELRRDPIVETNWATFKAGGPPPVDDNLLAYYCCYNLPPSRWWALRNLWLKRRVPARFADLLYAQIREVFPRRPIFPSILKVPNAARPRKAKNGASPNIAPPPKEKGYSIEW